MLRARMRAAAGLLLLMLLDGAAYELNLRPNAFILRRPDVLVVAPSLPVAAPDEDEERRAGEAQAAAFKQSIEELILALKNLLILP